VNTAEVKELNNVLEQISERFDQLEGYRGVGEFVQSAKTPVADTAEEVLRYSQLGITDSDISDNTMLGTENIDWSGRNVSVGALALANPAFDDLQGLSTQFRLPASNPPAFTAWVGNTYALEFPTGVDRYSYFIIQVTHRYKQDTTMHPHFHVGFKTAGAGYSTWECEYVWSSINYKYPTSSTTLSVNKDMNNIDPYNHTIIGFDDHLELGNEPKNISSIILGRIGRLGSSDTFGQSIWLFSFDLHYEVDAMGSGLEHTK
jgi:hypothetical protein